MAMTVDQIAQLIVTALTTLFGYGAVAARMKNYVTVDEYRTKVSYLHDRINDLREKIIRMEERTQK